MHNICDDDFFILFSVIIYHCGNSSEVIPMLSALFLKKLDFVKESYLLEVIPIKIKATDKSRWKV